VQFLTDNLIVIMQRNSVTVPSHSFRPKFTVTSSRPEVDAVYAQHFAGQRRAVSEVGTSTDRWRRDGRRTAGHWEEGIAAERDAL